MKTETMTGEATNRPWKINQHDPLSVKDSTGHHIAQTEWDCAFNRNYELNCANAQLIITAVNEWEALKAVAEAMPDIFAVIEARVRGCEINDWQTKLGRGRDALANLHALRNK